LEISDISPTHPENHPGPNSVTPSICEANRERKQPRCPAQYFVNGGWAADRLDRVPALGRSCAGNPGPNGRVATPDGYAAVQNKYRRRGHRKQTALAASAAAARALAAAACATKRPGQARPAPTHSALIAANILDLEGRMQAATARSGPIEAPGGDPAEGA
jgi:hypothetical protein